MFLLLRPWRGTLAFAVRHERRAAQGAAGSRGRSLCSEGVPAVTFELQTVRTQLWYCRDNPSLPQSGGVTRAHKAGAAAFCDSASGSSTEGADDGH